MVRLGALRVDWFICTSTGGITGRATRGVTLPLTVFFIWKTPGGLTVARSYAARSLGVALI